MTDEVLVDISHGVMLVTINRPQAKNAANLAVAQGVSAAMDELDANPDIRVAILCGADNTFCAGMDLKAFVKGEHPITERGFAGVCAIPPKKPLIAAVEGYALAGGFEIALASDLIVCAENAVFGLPEAKRGLVAGAGGVMRLPRQISRRIAKEMALTGEPISALRAYELGLVNKVVPKATAVEAAKELAAMIAANGPLAVRSAKEIMDTSEDWATHEFFAKQDPYIEAVTNSEDAIEGATAFAEKRAPVWKGG